jgi:ketosteroid isomerase-like protein
MKGFIAVVIVLVLAGLAAWAYFTTSSTAPPEMTDAEIAQIEAEVMAFEERKAAAFSTLDPDRLMDFWADGEISLFNFDQDRYVGQEEIRAFYEDLFGTWAQTQMEWLPGSTIDVLSPDLALFLGSVRQPLTYQEGGNYVAYVHFTDLLRKIDGEWKTQRSHASGRVVREG